MYNIIGAVWNLALIGEDGGILGAPIGEAERIHSAKMKFSRIFFMFPALYLLAEYKSQNK
jgi:hypothetical protein